MREVTRFKVLKGQMYGRASSALLRKHVIHHPGKRDPGIRVQYRILRSSTYDKPLHSGDLYLFANDIFTN